MIRRLPFAALRAGLFWLLWRVPLGPLAPHVLALALDRPATKVEDE